MSKFIKLLAPAFVVPDRKDWYGQTLGPGSICEVNPNGSVSPIGAPGEIPVHWMDGGGNVATGWLSARTPHTTATGRATLRREPTDEMMNAVDRLRHYVAATRVESPKETIPLGQWLVSFGPRHIELLNAVRRELGSKPSPNDTKATTISRVWRLLLPGDAPMDQIEDSVEKHESATPAAGDAAQTDDSVKAKGRKRAATKKAPAKKTTAKAPSTGKKGTTVNKEEQVATKEKTTRKHATTTSKKAAGDAPARSMAITLGNTLAPLLGNKDARALATRLKNNDIPSKRDLTKLRDFVNEAASSAREGDKAPLASKLSSANRLVRRLIRQQA